MNIIKEQANDFLGRTSHSSGQYNDYMAKVISKLYDFKKDRYKIEFLHYLMQSFKEEEVEHEVHCKNPKTCTESKFYRQILFLLTEELEDIKKNTDEDPFYEKDKSEINDKLDDILAQFQTLKNGQEIIYEDLSQELNSMKEYFFLDRKTWSQLFIGKLTTMVSSGIITQTVSKEIVKMIEDGHNTLIG
jgi:predicted CopG family antitoxin